MNTQTEVQHMQRDVHPEPLGRARVDSQTEVKIGPATIIGYAVAALTAIIAAIDALSGTGLGGDGELLLKVSAVLTAVVTFGRQLQAAMAKIFPPRSDV